jgi:5-methylcytosine-specific restriction endonuclease McrA
MPLINAQNLPKAVLDCFSAALAQGVDWKDAAAKAAKNALIEHLMEVQESRCAYCKRLIKNEIGLLEIDHILPQAARGKVAARKISNKRKDRRVTDGYYAFRFEPTNLILTCKRCNHRKGSYDCRRDRSTAIGAAYPTTAADFEWVHPVHHDFSDHIALLSEFVFQEIPGSNGSAVIDACQLAGIEALEARARELRLRGIKDVNKLILTLMLGDLPDDDIVDTVMQQFPKAADQQIRKSVRAYRDNRIS